MSKFTRFRAYNRVLTSRTDYVLRDALHWDIGRYGSSWILVIKSGTVFQISTPRWLEWLVSPHDRQVILAAAIHDELLLLGYDEAFAASEFRRAVRALGGGALKAWLLFFATLFYTTFRVNLLKLRDRL